MVRYELSTRRSTENQRNNILIGLAPSVEQDELRGPGPNPNAEPITRELS